MTMLDAINTYKQALATYNNKKQEFLDLRNTRLPELRNRLNANSLSMENAKLAMRNALTDAEYDTAKQNYQQAEVVYSDCVQLIDNVEAKLKAWADIEHNQLQKSVEMTAKTMWNLKQEEVFATLPAELPDSLRIGIQKLMTITSMLGGVGDGYYGSRVNKVYGQVDTDELMTTRAALLTEMGL